MYTKKSFKSTLVKFKIQNLLLSLVFLFSSLSFAFKSLQVTNSEKWLEQITPLQSLEFVSTPEEDHTPLFKAFDEAKKSIYIGIFGISSSKMADEIIKQSKRGIEVTIICDKYCTSNDKRKTLINKLQEAGIKVYTASTGFSITHWKMFVVDEKKAFISTMNFVSRTDQMRDIGVFTTEPSVVKEIVEVFKQDIENSKNNTAVTPELTSAHLIWSPNNSESKLIDLINSAQSTIEIWIENMGQQNIHNALQNAVKRGVNVRILTSICGLGMPTEMAHPILQDLIKRGVNVKGTPFPATTEIPYIHAKMINVDHAKIFIGSENFSYNSLNKSRELGIIFSDAKIQEQVSSLFEKDWKVSENIPDAAPGKCDALTPPKTKGGEDDNEKKN